MAMKLASTFVVGAAFLARTISASAAEVHARVPGYLAVLGGAGPTLGTLDAFTQQTAASPHNSASRPFDASGVVAMRAGWWMQGSPWGVGVEGSRVTLGTNGGAVTAWTLGGLMFVRPPSSESWRIFPYAGLGASLYALNAEADYRPNTAGSLSTVEADWPTGPWTFDARLGLQARTAPRLVLLAEARLTHFAMDRSWTPATWFGPPWNYRAGIKTDAVPILFQAGAALEF